MATQQPAVPIIVGVGDVRNKSFKVEDAVEPAQLMVNAVRRAVDDSGLDHAAQESLLAHVDSLRVVPTWTWAYNDVPGVISHRLGIKPTRRVLGEHGGNQPALQCDEAARDIAARRSLVSVLTGGEALASRKSFPRLPPLKKRGTVFVNSPSQLLPVKKPGKIPPRAGSSPIPTGSSWHLWTFPSSKRVGSRRLVRHIDVLV